MGLVVEADLGGHGAGGHSGEEQLAGQLDAAAGQVQVGWDGEAAGEGADKVRGVGVEQLSGLGEGEAGGQVRVEQVVKVIGNGTGRWRE